MSEQDRGLNHPVQAVARRPCKREAAGPSGRRSCYDVGAGSPGEAQEARRVGT